MGEDTRHYCDAFGTYKKIKKYRVIIQEVGATDPVPLEWTSDLSTRGLKRLCIFIKRGTSAASRETKAEIEQAEAAQPEPVPPVQGQLPVAPCVGDEIPY